MGLCGTKKAPSAGEPATPPDQRVETVQTVEDMEAYRKRSGSYDGEQSLRRVSSNEEERFRTKQSWKSVATECSLWRERLVTDNRGSVEACYTVDEVKLGEGSYGYVSKGVSRETSCVRAVKSLSKDIVKDVRRRFRQEIEIMKKLDHPNVIRLVETFEDKQHIFLVMELCEGGDLYHRLDQKGPFDEVDAAWVMEHMFRPICYMHSRHICHRDMKPENFLLLNKEPPERNTLKLIDFGFSRPFEPGQLLSTKLGTPRYSSPQVLAGRYDQSCDLWSCGVIMYVILSGDSPWPGKSDAEVLSAVRRGNYRFAAPVWRATSEDAKALIRLLLKYQPEERYTAQQALAHPWISNAPIKPSGSGEDARPSVVIANLLNFCRQSRFRQAALQIVARQLPEEEIQAYRQSFAALDTQGKGTLLVTELAEGLQDSQQRRRSIEELILDGEAAEVMYTDFVAAALDTGRHLTQGMCRAAFRAFDKDGDGKITQDELEALLKNGSGDVATTAADIAALLKEADTNGDGVVDFEEFRQMLTKGGRGRL